MPGIRQHFVVLTAAAFAKLQPAYFRNAFLAAASP
jgi:hypothetical protein